MGDGSGVGEFGAPNLTHDDPGTGILWSRVNVGEAVPGTVTPLTAEFMRPSMGISSRRVFHRMGVLRADEVYEPNLPAERSSQFLFGKMCLNVDYVRAIADRTPGMSGDSLEEAMLGRVRTGVSSKVDRSRYGIAAAQALRNILFLPGEIRRLASATQGWWQDAVRRAETAGLAEAAALFDEARDRYERVMDTHSLIAMLAPAFWESLAREVRALTDEGDLLALTAGYGGLKEARLMEDVWSAAKQDRPLSTLLSAYGYMAQDAGELSSFSWRERPQMLSAMIAGFRDAPESDSPAARQAATSAGYIAARARIMKGAGPARRLRLALLLSLSRRMLPVRETSKAAMMQAPDAGRAAARALGRHLAKRGDIADAEDVFMLSLAEVREAPLRKRDLRGLVDERRRQRAQYAEIDLPDFFTSQDVRDMIRERMNGEKPAAAAESGERVVDLTGVAASPGRVRGRARLVRDASATTNFARGDVLVSATTDPGGTPLFALASAIVTDIGGMLSHSAIIARELKIPAVVNTRRATKVIPDGALLEVDGTAGTVKILSLNEGT